MGIPAPEQGERHARHADDAERDRPYIEQNHRQRQILRRDEQCRCNDAQGNARDARLAATYPLLARCQSGLLLPAARTRHANKGHGRSDERDHQHNRIEQRPAACSRRVGESARCVRKSASCRLVIGFGHVVASSYIRHIGKDLSRH